MDEEYGQCEHEKEKMSALQTTLGPECYLHMDSYQKKKKNKI